jgi:hypothetical protein
MDNVSDTEWPDDFFSPLDDENLHLATHDRDLEFLPQGTFLFYKLPTPASSGSWSSRRLSAAILGYWGNSWFAKEVTM